MENLPQLQDIHLPVSPSFWPLAIGWWFLLSVAIFLLAWFFLTLYRKAKLKKRQKQMLAKFTQLEVKLKQQPSNAAIAEINTLLRQLAINTYPREKIASLTGGDWLHFLDQSGKTTNFSKGAGRILIEAPYQQETATGLLENFNQDEFLPLIKKWIKTLVKNGQIS